MRLQANVHWILIGGIGLIGGLLNGMLGVGAAIFLVPCLTVVLGLPQLTAQGTVLWIMVPMSLTSAIRYSMKPDIGLDFPLIIVMSVLAIVGANFGSSMAFTLPVDILKKSFGVFIVAVGVFMFFK